MRQSRSLILAALLGVTVASGACTQTADEARDATKEGAATAIDEAQKAGESMADAAIDMADRAADTTKGLADDIATTTMDVTAMGITATRAGVPVGVPASGLGTVLLIVLIVYLLGGLR